MDFPKSSVFFMEEDSAIAAGSKPLMLEAVLSCPILKWMSSQLLADGVQRFFVVCSPRFAEEARQCFPAGADVTVSEQQPNLSEEDYNVWLNQDGDKPDYPYQYGMWQYDTQGSIKGIDGDVAMSISFVDYSKK